MRGLSRRGKESRAEGVEERRDAMVGGVVRVGKGRVE